MRKIILTEDQIKYIKEKKSRKKPAIFEEERDDSHPYFPTESEEFTTDDGRKYKSYLTIKNDYNWKYHIALINSDPNSYLVFQQVNKEDLPIQIATIPPDVFRFIKGLPL